MCDCSRCIFAYGENLGLGRCVCLTYVCADDAATDKHWQMADGFPTSWESAWAELAWRHPRAHRPVPEANGASSTAGVAGQDTTQGKQSTSIAPPQTDLPIAIVNGVSGRNNPRKDKARAMSNADLRALVAAMPAHLDQVKKGMLVFISVDLASAEGEFAIGLARAVADCDSGDCQFTWFIRKEWCNKERKHKWSKSPTFRLAADPTNAKKAYVTKEPLAKVLPVQVTLTTTSKHNLPRLHADCVRTIRELCVQRGLLCNHEPVTIEQSEATKNAS